ncbi:MAG: glycosyltransferase, partial [Deltaproteobacteria bacterium]|nr:glycosyltransferase [Deltaproteobacteria bacterium]
HVDRAQFDVRLGVLATMGAYCGQLDRRWLLSRATETRWGNTGTNRDWLTAAGLWRAAASPARVYGWLRSFRPHVVVSFMKGMAMCALPALAVHGRRRVGWIVREGNNVDAVIDDEMATRAGGGAMRWLVRRAYRSADVVVAISDGVASCVTDSLGVDRQRVRRIYNAVDLELVTRRAAEPRDGLPERFLLAAGRLEHQKGFDVLVRAFSETRARHETQLVILGEGPERRSLEALVRDCGLTGRVSMPGFVDNPWSYMARAQAFVLPSRWEGFGNVVVEAMACGTPVIVTDCDYGPREVVRHGVSGLVVRSEDAGELARSIDLVCEDRPLRGALGARGAERARDFDVRGVVRRYEDVFRIAARSAGRAPYNASCARTVDAPRGSCPSP